MTMLFTTLSVTVSITQTTKSSPLALRPLTYKSVPSSLTAMAAAALMFSIVSTTVFVSVSMTVTVPFTKSEA